MENVRYLTKVEIIRKENNEKIIKQQSKSTFNCNRKSYTKNNS